MWRIMKGKLDENRTFLSPNILPNLICCMSSCNHAWVFSRNFGIWMSALNDDNECFQDGIYMSNNWHFLMVGSCVTTMNIKNVGSYVNNIHFVICSLVVMIIIYPFNFWNITEYKKSLFSYLWIMPICISMLMKQSAIEYRWKRNVGKW